MASFGIGCIKMKVNFEKKNVDEVKADVVIVPCLEKRLPEWATEVLKNSGMEKDFDGSKKTSLLLPAPKKTYKRILLMGLGKEAKVKLEDFRVLGGKAYSEIRKANLEKAALWVTDRMELSRADASAAFVEGFVLKSLKLDIYKTKKEDDEKEEKEISLTVYSEEDLGRRVKEAVVLSEAQNYARLMDVEPSNILSPVKLADKALSLSKKYGMDCRVFTIGELKKKGMGGIISVGRGSAKPPAMVCLTYNKGKDLPHIALVGKAITFDSGGISLKPGRGMASMKYDKSGALVLMGVMQALAELKVPVKATLVFGAAENMPDGNSTNPGDVITTFSGKTIEIINTDAEGRVCLADAVAYAASQKPDLIVDVATLTGAANIVLGRYGICMMGTDELALNLFEDAGMETYERVWPLPVWEEYSEMIKSDIADVKNLGSETGEAGTITAGMFIKEFNSDLPWIHLDIASVDLIEHPSAYLPKGPSARGVRLITSFIKKWAQNQE